MRILLKNLGRKLSFKKGEGTQYISASMSKIGKIGVGLNRERLGMISKIIELTFAPRSLTEQKIPWQDVYYNFGLLHVAA